MSDLKIHHSVRQPALVRQSGIPGHARTLQTANREALRHLGWPIDATEDPKGRQLRQLRLQLGIDPALLATHACMSLSQLYELEDGGNSRFYSDSLRRQAARRVARLLGADWDQMLSDDRQQMTGVSNVVPLQRPVALMPLMASSHENQTHTLPENTSDVTRMTTPATGDEGLPISMGLAIPATETLLVTPHSECYTAPAGSAKERSTGGFNSVMLLLIGFGTIAVYAFNEYSPYRFYWPW